MNNPYKKCKECEYCIEPETNLCVLGLTKDFNNKCPMQKAWDKGYDRGFVEGAREEYETRKEGGFF